MRTVMVRPNRMARDLDNMFNSIWNSPAASGENCCDFMPRVNIKETNDDIALTFEVPGMDKNDFKVTVKEDILTVSGERKDQTEEQTDQYVRNEIRTGSFSRSFTLPETVDTGEISADYRQGMLEVKLAKKEVVKPKEIEVSVS